MNRALGIAATASALLHGALLLLLLPHAPARPGFDQVPAVEVELVDEAAAARGAAPAEGAKAGPEAHDEPQRQQPDPVRAEEGEAPAAPPPAPPARPRMEVNLSGSDEDRAPMLVTGRDVVPPRPDAAIHNRPPAYPPDAARRRAEGVVGLVIHVTAAGVPAWVDVQVSSGDPSLDEAARDAVAMWRFQPARNGSVAVPFDLPYVIRFSLGDGQRSVGNGQDRPGRYQGR